MVVRYFLVICNLSLDVVRLLAVRSNRLFYYIIQNATVRHSVVESFSVSLRSALGWWHITLFSMQIWEWFKVAGQIPVFATAVVQRLVDSASSICVRERSLSCSLRPQSAWSSFNQTDCVLSGFDRVVCAVVWCEFHPLMISLYSRPGARETCHFQTISIVYNTEINNRNLHDANKV